MFHQHTDSFVSSEPTVAISIRPFYLPTPQYNCLFENYGENYHWLYVHKELGEVFDTVSRRVTVVRASIF